MKNEFDPPERPEDDTDEDDVPFDNYPTGD